MHPSAFDPYYLYLIFLLYLVSYFDLCFKSLFVIQSRASLDSLLFSIEYRLNFSILILVEVNETLDLVLQVFFSVDC